MLAMHAQRLHPTHVAGAQQHELIVPAWHELYKRVASFYVVAIATSTTHVCDNHSTYWAQFCVLFGMHDVFADPSEQAACLTMARLSLSNIHSTVRKTMAGVNYLWTSMGVSSARLTMVHVHAHDARAAPAERQDAQPEAYHLSCGPDVRSRMVLTTPFAAAVWACMLTTHWGMLRKSNTTAGNSNLLDTGSCTCLCDIDSADVAYTVTLNVRKSKTNQYHDRVHRLVLQGHAGHPIDPVQGQKNHLMLNTLAGGTRCSYFAKEHSTSNIR